MTDDDRIFPDLSDLVIMLLASTLSGLRDRLRADGFLEASEFVADLAERCDSYIEQAAP
jgi:hypothetical protein